MKEFEVKAAGSLRRIPPQSAAQPSPALPLENYAGLYENDLYGQAQVTCEKGQLKMHLGQIEALLILMRDNRLYDLRTDHVCWQNACVLHLKQRENHSSV